MRCSICGGVQSGMRGHLSGHCATCEKIAKSTAGTGTSGPLSLSDEIRKLKELYDAGVLTDVEFELAKAKVLEK